MPVREGDLSLLIAAAEGAGAIARRHFRADPKVWEKEGGQGPVTEADLEVNDFLRARLTAARPGYGWMSEESDPLGDLSRLAAETAFVIDPIDGTRAFAAGETSFAHALAVVRQGRPVAAVVHLPMLGLTYSAARGAGAWLNGAQLAASGREDPEGARVLASRPAFEPAVWPGGVPGVKRFFRPSLAWRLALVGEGRFDAMITLRDTWDWDIAASTLIAEEAGARVTGRAGQPLRFNTGSARSPGVLAAPPALHGAFLAAMTPSPSHPAIHNGA